MWINNELFLIKDSEVPVIPIEFSQESKEWWAEQKRRCIEGYTVGGKWMSPNIYFYVNFWRIALSKSKASKSKSMGRPWLRDIEWILGTSWSLARGISGFDNTKIPDNLSTEEKMDFLWNLNSKDPGSPVYDNEATDLMVMGPRDFGKTEFIAGGIIAHEFLFNGAKKYYPPGTSPEKTVAEITVGAGSTGYTNTLFTKFKYGYDALTQMGLEFGGKVYPHPFIQKFDGALTPSKMIIAQYKKNIGGEWRFFGSKSKIRHVAYGDNPYAAQGTRNSVMIKEEIGEFDKLIECQENDLETMKNGSLKSGSCLYLGTGGNMGSGTLGAYKMFYSPETYNILPFNDKWENKGKIGLFIPGTYRYQDFKDAEGRTNEPLAYKFEIDEREKLKKKKNSKQALLKHIQYNPLVPSEIFLRSVGNIFPVQDLATVLSELELGQRGHYQWNVELKQNEKGKVSWEANNNLTPIEEFPLKDKREEDGCVVIFEPPKFQEWETEPEYGRYIASLDPYNQNKAEDSLSLGSTFILDTWTNKISAEYTGRPSTDKIYYNNVLRLLKLYNAMLLYENMFKSTYDFFEYNHSLQYLVKTPTYLKDVIPNSRVDRGYGMHMDSKGEIRFHGERKLLEWLTERTGNPDNPERMNLHNIKSIPLLKELILYDGGETNTDRVDSMILMMYQLRQIAKNREIPQEDIYIPIFKHSFFSTPLRSPR